MHFFHSLVFVLVLFFPALTLAQDTSSPAAPSNLRQAGVVVPSCNNDSVLHLGEICDDGNTNPNDGCHQCGFAVPSNGQVHWVNQSDANCSDSGDGMSQPFCGLPGVAGHRYQPGDSVVFRAGDYSWPGKDRSGMNYYEQADVMLQDSGTSSAPIVFMAYPGEEVIVRNDTTSPTAHYKKPGFPVWGFRDESYIVFQGFVIPGMFNTSGASHLVIRNNHFLGITQDGVDYYSNYTGLHLYFGQHNLVRNNKFENYIGQGGVNNHGIMTRGNDSGTHLVAENNYFHNNGTGFRQKYGGKFDRIRKNVFERNTQAGYRVRRGNTADDSVFDQNLISQNLFLSDSLYVDEIHYQKDELSEVRNNVFINSRLAETHYSATHRILNYFNNIYLGSGTVYESNTGSRHGALANNLYSSFRADIQNGDRETSFAEWQALGYDLNSQIADPMFVSDRYALGPNSPARGAGQNGEDLGLYPDSDTSIAIGPTW